MTNATIAKQIRYHRWMAGMTQGDLANATGLAAEAIAAFEAGEARPATMQVAEIAMALNIPPATFYRGRASSADVVSIEGGRLADRVRVARARIVEESSRQEELVAGIVDMLAPQPKPILVSVR